MGCQCKKCKNEEILEEKDLRQIENGMNNQLFAQNELMFIMVVLAIQIIITKNNNKIIPSRLKAYGFIISNLNII